MGSITRTQFVFDRPLFLDRKRGKYSFISNEDSVQVVSAGSESDMKSLELLFNPFTPVKIAEPWDMFEDEVLRYLESLEPRGAPSHDRIAPDEASTDEGESFSALPSASDGDESESSTPDAPPVESVTFKEVRDTRRKTQRQLSRWLESAEGHASLINGACDGAIREMVVRACRAMLPEQILQMPSLNGSKSNSAHAADTALTSQAFGKGMHLRDEELFRVAKSAMVQGTSVTAFNNILLLKQKILMGESSPRYTSMVKQYYGHLQNFFQKHRVPDEIARTVDDSKYVYLGKPTNEIKDEAVALGTADAFVSLKEAQKKTLEIIEALPDRLRSVLPKNLRKSVADSAEGMLRASCYSEHPLVEEVPRLEGEHASFIAMEGSRYGILVLRVNGQDDEVSSIRDLLGYVLERMPDRGDPAHVLGVLNRFGLKYPFPSDVHVAAVYGVVDAPGNTFTYATAGQPAPCLVRHGVVTLLESTSGLAFNLKDEGYENASVPLQPVDGLVFLPDSIAETYQEQRAQQGGGPAVSAHGDVEALIVALARGERVAVPENLRFQVYKHL